MILLAGGERGGRSPPKKVVKRAKLRFTAGLDLLTLKQEKQQRQKRNAEVSPYSPYHVDNAGTLSVNKYCSNQFILQIKN